jgi:membrane fusion protein, multidrug efflux system
MTMFAPSKLTDMVPIGILAHSPVRVGRIVERERAGCTRGSCPQPASAIKVPLLLAAVFLALADFAVPRATAQPMPSGPPAVGVITVQREAMTDSYEFNGRIQAVGNVNVVARVTAFLEQQHFTEGSDVNKGDLLYTLERPPFQAALDVQKGAVAQAKAQLDNDNIELWRKQQLLEKNAGTQQAVDAAQATQRVASAQLESARAQLATAQINLDYTTIRSPIDGRIGRMSVTVGNVVGPTTGTLTTIVSQDPMYVLFPVPTRRAIELRETYGEAGGFDAVKIRLRLPDGRMYGHTGKLDFVNNTIAQDTDTFLLRAVIANPVLGQQVAGGVSLRELVADEFVTVVVESVRPNSVVAVPRAAILSDQQGSYVYVVDDQSIARQRRVRLGQLTPETAGIAGGVKEGERVIVEGVQRARPNAPVAPAPAMSIAGRS